MISGIAQNQWSSLGLSLALLMMLAVSPLLLKAQNTDTNPPQTQTASPPEASDPETIFPHSQTARWWVSGQINLIAQGHGAFSALYSGQNSLKPTSETALSRIFTLYTAARLTHSIDVVFDLEEASGKGISDSVGLGGYTNIDVVRIPGQGTPLSTAPYVARAIFRYVLPLSRETEDGGSGPMGVLDSLPVRRLQFRAGKMALADFFDVNPVASDSHLQFMNWTLVNNGAWDFAADTRGYTYAAILEYDDRSWALRFAEALMPTVSNGIVLDTDLSRARAENLEWELHPRLGLKIPAQLRLLSYVNHANMGDYRQAVNLFLEGKTPAPDIVATRQPGSVKYGFGANFEQQVTPSLRLFSRAGWNDGRHESFAYTEVDNTFSLGGDYRGYSWHRDHDKAGLAFVTNGISPEHADYLRLGGLGFLLGDGNLTYGRENIFEGYYTAHFWRGVYGAFDLQHVQDPGYNRDRGPVWVPAIRLHIEL
jgi:high affinity Mn2+ porin